MGPLDTTPPPFSLLWLKVPVNSVPGRSGSSYWSPGFRRLDCRSAVRLLHNYISFSRDFLSFNTAKKVAFTVQKTRGEFTQKVAFAYIHWCSPIWKSKIFQPFCYRWMRVFVPLSGSFPFRRTAENARLLEFTGRLTLGECVVCLRSQMFSGSKTTRSSGVNDWKPAFSLVFQSAKRW